MNIKKIFSLLLVVIMLSGCAVGKKNVTITNTSAAEYDIIHPLIRMYFNAAKDYDTAKCNTSVSSMYIQSDTKPNPVKLTWAYGENDSVLNARVYVSQSEDFAEADFYYTTENSLELQNVYTGTKYYWYVEAFTEKGSTKSEVFTFDVASGVRLITIDGVPNCRDLGGWKTVDGKTVKEGLAYRTARLSGSSGVLITQKGIDTAVNQLKIKTELDLRGESEMLNEKVPEYGELGETVNYVNIPATAYAYIFTSSKARDELMLFADIDNYPILFHCAAGADRTGTLAFIIKALLGVSETDLICDHELTYTRYINDNEYSYSDMVKTFEKIKGDSYSDKARYFMTKQLLMSEMAVSNIYNIFLNDGAIFHKDSLTVPKCSDGKVSYKLIMRSSQSISSVEIDGSSAEFSIEADTLTITAPSGRHYGSITFDDGTKLNFSYK